MLYVGISIFLMKTSNMFRVDLSMSVTSSTFMPVTLVQSKQVYFHLKFYLKMVNNELFLSGEEKCAAYYIRS